jgi:hypothetical protein
MALGGGGFINVCMVNLVLQANYSGRYTCHATNEAGVLDTDYELDVIGKNL